MRKYLSLTRVLLKDAGSSFELKFGQKNRKWVGPVFWCFIGIGLLPLMAVFYAMFHGLYAAFAPTGQLAYITGLIFNVVGLVVFIFSAFSAPAIFYFGREVEYLLPMPLTPEQITGAKFTVSLLFEYLLILFVIGPMYVAYVAYLPPGVLTVNILLIFLTLPVLPLIYSTVLVMLLMRVTRFGRNRDTYNMVVGFIAVVFGLGVGLFSQRLNTVSTDQVLAMIEGNSTVWMTLRSLFPNSIFAGRAIAEGSFADQALNLLITAAALGVFFLLARVLYFKGVIGVSESGTPSKKMTRAEILRGTRGQSMFRACLQKELRMLFRSPIAFTNCVMMVLLLPFMLVVPIVMSMGADSAELSALLIVDFNNPSTVAGILTGAAAAGFLLSAMNMVTSTSISREGPNYFVMKYIPVPYRVQLNAKAASGLLVSLSGMALMLVLLEVVFKAPLWVFIMVLLLTLPGTVFLNYLGLLIDLMKPKLLWDNERLAVKQNLNVMFLMLAGMVLTAVIAVAGALLLKTPLTAFIGLMALGTVLALGAYHFVLNIGEEQMSKL